MTIRTSRFWRAAKLGLVGLFVGALAFGAMNLVNRPRGVVAAGDFTITSTVTEFSGSTCTGTAASLYPGGPVECLTYNVKNNININVIVEFGAQGRGCG